MVEREPEARAVSDLLNDACEGPAALVIEGEAGIGKTTLLLDAADQAVERGFRVLSARGSPAEVSYAYAAVADLLSGVDEALVAELTAVQRIALDRARSGEVLVGGPATDERVVAAAFLAVIERISTGTAVLLAIDDAQWLDASSRAVVRFAVRRLSGAVGMLVTSRSGESSTTDVVSWLQLPRPDTVTRLRMSPLTLGGLHTMVSARLGRVLPRPMMMRIHEISGGNPLYASELARAVADGDSIDRQLPDTLAALVRARVQDVDVETAQLLLAAACTPAPTVVLVAMATATPAQRVVELLERSETARIVVINGTQIRFTHPLLATGVYTHATPARRRAMHRALAGIDERPEVKARHLALAATSADAATLEALDAAADVTNAQGAFAAAAELTEMAINIGGDNPLRRIQAAQRHLRSGNLVRADMMLDTRTVDQLSGPMRAMALGTRAGMRIYTSSFSEAATLLEQAYEQIAEIPSMAAPLLVFLSYAQLSAGRCAAALATASEGLRRAETLDIPSLTSQALAAHANALFFNGQGVNDAELQRALALQDPDSDVVIPLGADAISAMLLAWAGRVDEAQPHMNAVRQRCLDRGADTEMLWVEIHSTMLNWWRGDLNAAHQSAEEAVQRAQQLGGDSILTMALTSRAWVAALTGRIDDARAAGAQAMQAAHRCGDSEAALRPIECRAYLENFVGNYAQALNILQPRLRSFTDLPNTEFSTAAFIPIAVEAMIALGQTDDAEPLIESLENNGTRLDRPWMLAIGARCRAMAHAHCGDLAAAEQSAHRAMTYHQRLPMPFETATTQVLLGQIQRRRRHKPAAAATLGEALRTFEDIGAPLWAERARAELARLSGTNDDPQSGLTPAEQRIAQRAAAGLSNKEIATEQFLALKTVEMILSNVYRKLGIRSRTQLHARLDPANSRDIPGSPPAQEQ
ncbi:DNA-binding CsgD family transcriptional regulator/Tfp pilus assembly protein PilF [Mycobacterium sp. OAE908]|uniref:ATP-binding protein n=1 Tax=Mycobacterium sp. OAE908 TaxID=2817899 RepID=UPI0034E2C2D9